jgi:hypothetical protein
MIQVSLPNVVNHAKASRVTIHQALVDGWVKCAVIYDGIGIDANRSNSASSGGLGLLGVQERAETLGGRVVVSPVLPHGTDVSIYIPLIKYSNKLLWVHDFLVYGVTHQPCCIPDTQIRLELAASDQQFLVGYTQMGRCLEHGFAFGDRFQ